MPASQSAKAQSITLPGAPTRRVEVKPSAIGKGLFAKRTFRRGEPIITIGGRVVHYQVLWDVGGAFADNCIRFGPETYLDPGDGPARFINHSCEPNAAIGKTRNQLYLFAIDEIATGDEIFFDYSTTIGDDDVWVMRCGCRRSSCRKRIARFGLLPGALKDRYIRNGVVPKFIIRTLE